MAIKEAIAPETKPNRLKMSYEAFLQWADEDTCAEWDASTGEVIILMPPKNIHQVTLGFLYQLLDSFVRLFNLGKVGIAPFEVKLTPTGSSREPDIFFVSNQNLARLTEERLVGPADLMIEIISDDSVQRDRDKKFKEYSDAGVLEYWIIDPRSGKQRADFYRLNETDGYQLFATEDDERVESYVLPGFWLRPAWLWQADTLDPLSLFFEMRGLSAEQAQHIQQLLRSEQADEGTDD
ncbi:MAG: Uma2 family endonuclease [Chloroflexi bacterium]|nr:Uma2 family endonuclease [Chloroflexota bacterium]